MTDTAKQQDYIGHRQRLRERFLLSEGRDMADYELLELVLTMAIPRRDVKPLAKILIKHFGSFAGVINAKNDDLLAVDGVKENTLAMFKVIKAASLRTSWQCLEASDQAAILDTNDLLEYCRAAMCFSDVEELRIIYLNSKLRVMAEELMQRGTTNCVYIHPREVVRAAVAKSATAIIMVHNHPSGDPTPSEADVTMTKQVATACTAVNIKLCDHIIITRYDHYSFHDTGFI